MQRRSRKMKIILIILVQFPEGKGIQMLKINAPTTIKFLFTGLFRLLLHLVP